MPEPIEREVELVREAYRRWNAGEMERFMEMVDEDVEWIPPSYAPDPGPHLGREAVMRGLESYFETFEEFRPTPDAIYATGRPGRYLVLVSTFTRGRKSGVETTIDVGHVVEVRDERLVRLEVHPDRGDAFEAAGLDAAEPPENLAGRAG